MPFWSLKFARTVQHRCIKYAGIYKLTPVFWQPSIATPFSALNTINGLFHLYHRLLCRHLCWGRVSSHQWRRWRFHRNWHLCRCMRCTFPHCAIAASFYHHCTFLLCLDQTSCVEMSNWILVWCTYIEVRVTNLPFNVSVLLASWVTNHPHSDMD